MSASPIIMPAPGADKVDAPAPDADASDPKQALAAAPPFAGLSDAVLEAVCKDAETRHYESGQTVFSMGQFDGAEFYVVVAGKLRVSLLDPESGSVLVDDIGPATVFGLDITFAESDITEFQRLAVTAEEDLTLLAVDAAALRALAAQRPSLMRNLAQYFAGELSMRRFSAVASEAAPQQRVFCELLKFIERDAVSGSWRVPRMPKHRELADLAGVDEGVAAGAIAALIQEGVARRDYPGLIVDDMARFHELTG